MKFEIGNIVRLPGQNGNLVIISHIEEHITHWVGFNANENGFTPNKTFESEEPNPDSSMWESPTHIVTIWGMEEAVKVADSMKTFLNKKTKDIFS